MLLGLCCKKLEFVKSFEIEADQMSRNSTFDSCIFFERLYKHRVNLYFLWGCSENKGKVQYMRLAKRLSQCKLLHKTIPARKVKSLFPLPTYTLEVAEVVLLINSGANQSFLAPRVPFSDWLYFPLIVLN